MEVRRDGDGGDVAMGSDGGGDLVARMDGSEVAVEREAQGTAGSGGLVVEMRDGGSGGDDEASRVGTPAERPSGVGTVAMEGVGPSGDGGGMVQVVREETQPSGEGSTPGLVGSTPVTPGGSMTVMEMEGLDVEVERRATGGGRSLFESVVPRELLEARLDTPIVEAEEEEEDDETQASRRRERGKSVVTEGENQEEQTRREDDPLSVPLFIPPLGTSGEIGVSLRDTAEFAQLEDVTARVQEFPALLTQLGPELLQEVEREEEEREEREQVPRPRVPLVEEVRACTRPRPRFTA